MKLPIVIVTFGRTGRVEAVTYEYVTTAEELIAVLIKVQSGQQVWISEAVAATLVEVGVKEKRFSFKGKRHPDERISIGGIICYIRLQDVIDAIVVALSSPNIQAINIPAGTENIT